MSGEDKLGRGGKQMNNKYVIITGAVFALILFSLILGAIYRENQQTTCIIKEQPPNIELKMDCQPCVCECETVKEVDLGACKDYIIAAKQFEKDLEKLR